MWKDNIPWDREVEVNLKLEFIKWFEELISLKNLSVSRSVSPVISVTKPVFDEPSILKEKRKTGSTSKNLPVVCFLNQCENNKNNGETNNEDADWYYYYFSSYGRMLRMTAWMKRFIFNCRNSNSQVTGELSHAELKRAEIKIVKMVHDEYFTHEVNRKKMNSLATYKDEEGILRVKTKLTYRKDSEDSKNSTILPSHHPVVERLIMTENKKN
ncbi:integrase_H2C2 domain-containing protein [Nephila pilipes]|uniref:Integrase_H2C2 domain-containing protein n=1 Tax=Nephila pilipes TaxID=299642 RepID=A0A8X6TXQ6_NEPPI|nr:integrase_H2C2 domain-containing protein [Nephila pilipes]